MKEEDPAQVLAKNMVEGEVQNPFTFLHLKAIKRLSTA